MKSVPLNSSTTPPSEAAAPVRLLPPVGAARPAGDAPDHGRRQGPTHWPDLPRGISLTSRSLTFSTERFSLDYTRRSVDVDPPAPPEQRTEPPEAGARPATPKKVMAPRSGREARRRAQLADLLTSPHPSRRGLTSDAPLPTPGAASPKAACRCYVATARGSGRGDHCFSA